MSICIFRSRALLDLWISECAAAALQAFQIDAFQTLVEWGASLDEKNGRLVTARDLVKAMKGDKDALGAARLRDSAARYVDGVMRREEAVKLLFKLVEGSDERKEKEFMDKLREVYKEDKGAAAPLGEIPYVPEFVNSRNALQYTPLHVARSPKFIEWLVKAGADVNARSFLGEVRSCTQVSDVPHSPLPPPSPPPRPPPPPDASVLCRAVPGHGLRGEAHRAARTRGCEAGQGRGGGWRECPGARAVPGVLWPTARGA